MEFIYNSTEETISAVYTSLVKAIVDMDIDVDVDTNTLEYKTLRRDVLNGTYGPEIRAVISLLYYSLCLIGTPDKAGMLPNTVGMNYCRLAMGHLVVSPGQTVSVIRSPSLNTLFRFSIGSVACSYGFSRADTVVQCLMDAHQFLIAPLESPVSSGSSSDESPVGSSASPASIISDDTWTSLYWSYVRLTWAYFARLHTHAVHKLVVRPFWTVVSLSPRPPRPDTANTGSGVTPAPAPAPAIPPVRGVNRVHLQRQLTTLMDLYRIAVFYYAHHRATAPPSPDAGASVPRVFYNPVFQWCNIQLLSISGQGLVQRLPSMDLVGVLLAAKAVVTAASFAVRYVTEMLQLHRRTVDSMGGHCRPMCTLSDERGHEQSQRNQDDPVTSASLSVSVISRCHICMEPLGAQRSPTVTPCGHLYCWGCIVQWCTGARGEGPIGSVSGGAVSVRQKHHCPLCRALISLPQLRRVYNY